MKPIYLQVAAATLAAALCLLSPAAAAPHGKDEAQQAAEAVAKEYIDAILQGHPGAAHDLLTSKLRALIPPDAFSRFAERRTAPVRAMAQRPKCLLLTEDRCVLQFLPPRGLDGHCCLEREKGQWRVASPTFDVLAGWLPMSKDQKDVLAKAEACVDAMVEGIRTGDWGPAYALFSPSSKAEISQAQFTGRMRAQVGIVDPTKALTFAMPRVNGRTAMVKAIFLARARNHGSGPKWVSMVAWAPYPFEREGGNWGMVGTKKRSLELFGAKGSARGDAP